VTALKDLLTIADLSREDLLRLVDDARALQDQPGRRNDTLAGRSVLLYFAKPSTRTRVSFETAVVRLGGTPISVGPDELQLGRGETIADTAEVLSRYCAAIVIRTFAHSDVATFAAHAAVPVVNALTDLHHPLQGLADLMTIRDHFGTTDGITVAYLGDGNNVCHSLVEACALAGVDVRVATPADYAPESRIIERATEDARTNGSAVTVTTDPDVALDGADVVYTDVWLSMGDSPDQLAARQAAFAPYCVDDAAMAKAKSRAIFMHCLPAHRGQEVAASVIDGPHSVVFDQAENRMHTEQALLVALLRGQLVGRASMPAVTAAR
jgi:ornithine carbamoyltransferase